MGQYQYIIKKTLISALLLLCTLCSAGDFGAGIVFGSPFGLCFKKRMTQKKAVDLVLSYGFGDHWFFHVHGDYLVHNYNLIRDKSFVIPFYYGPGVRVVLREEVHAGDHEDKLNVGVRFPVGLLYNFGKTGPDIDIFLELAPVMNLIPLDPDIDAGLGVRYYF